MPAKKTAKKTAKKATRQMSEDHKQALAEGRAQGKAVRDYLTALETERKSPGRKPTRTPQELQQAIDAEPDPAKRLELIQKRIDVENRLAAEQEAPDIQKLEREFIKAAKPYAARKGISYTAFRELGVPAAVLKEADIPRTRRTRP